MPIDLFRFVHATIIFTVVCLSLRQDKSGVCVYHLITENTGFVSVSSLSLPFSSFSFYFPLPVLILVFSFSLFTPLSWTLLTIDILGCISVFALIPQSTNIPIKPFWWQKKSNIGLFFSDACAYFWIPAP